MTGFSITNDALSRTFTTALLITGSAGQAEDAVLEGIRLMDRNKVSDEALLRATMAASIAAKTQVQGAEEQELASSMLPVELRRILRLSTDLRRCYVLRVLAGLPREICANMLQTDIHRIDESVCVSARALAGLPEGETSRWQAGAAIPAHA